MDSKTWNIRCLRFINQNVAYYDFKMCRIPQHLAKSNKYCDSACPRLWRSSNKLRFSKKLNTSGKNIFRHKENHYLYTVKIVVYYNILCITISIPSVLISDSNLIEQCLVSLYWAITTIHCSNENKNEWTYKAA